MKSLLTAIIVVAVAAIMTLSCTTADYTLGQEFAPTNQQMISRHRLYKNGILSELNEEDKPCRVFETRLFKTDTVNSECLGTFYLGLQKHDRFGVRRLGFASQFLHMIDVDDSVGFGYRPVYDSTTLIFELDTFVGDSTRPVQYNVYLLTDDLVDWEAEDTVFYVSYDPRVEGHIAQDAEPIFTFKFPDQENGVYTNSTEFRLQEGKGAKQLIHELFCMDKLDANGNATNNVDIYESDSAFVCSSDDSTNAAYTLGATTIGGEAVTGFKLGKSKQAGKFTSGAVGVEGTKYHNFYAQGWKGGNVTLYFRVDGGATQSQKLASHDGVTGNPPYTALAFADSDHYSIQLSGLTASSKIEFSTDANFALTTADSTMASARAIVCGVKLTDEALTPGEGGGNEPVNPDPEPEPTPDPTPGVVVATVAEFLAAAEGDTVYELTGVIKNVANTNYGNFDLQDATGTVYVYGLYDESGNKVFTSLGLKEGDTLTMRGVRTSYNEVPQVGSGVYVSHVSAPEQEQPANEAKLDFSVAANRISWDTDHQVWQANGITLTNNKGASTSNVADYTAPARFYKSSEIIVECDHAMAKIEFACNSASYATALQSSITSGNVTVDGSSVIVTFSTAVSSYTIASLTGGQVRMNSLTVTYAE